MKHVDDVTQEAYRLERRRALDVDADGLQACAGAPGWDRSRTAHRYRQYQTRPDPPASSGTPPHRIEDTV